VKPLPMNRLRRLARTLTLALFVLAAAAATARGEELRGKVELVARGGKGPARGSDVSQAVVYFEPASPAAVHAPAEPYKVVTLKKEFTPRVLAVPRGSRVRFPNQDPILHNVFSVSPDNAFDLGLYRKGPGKEALFARPGVVRVFCNVHHSMVSYVLVLDTPFFASPAADGSFVLANLPRGSGKLTVWHEQTEPWTASVRLPREAGAPPLAARLEVVRPLIPSHLNKLGKSYFGPGRDRYDQR
jgi:plastocyanin